MLALESAPPELADLTARVRAARRRWPGASRPTCAPRVGDAATDAMRVYVDHSRDVGTYHPAFPVYALRCADDRAEGEVTFPLVYEGPPGVVHGGFLALFFDCVLQQLNCDMGLAGKTTRLALRYRRPTPIGRPLRVVAHRTVDDDRIHSEAQLLDGDELLCSAEMSAFAGNRANLPAVSPGGPRDECRDDRLTTVGAVLAARAAARPEHDFVVCDDERLTYGEADRASRELARGLIGVGVGRGAHVALCFPTGVDFVVAWLACVRIGAVTVPISTFSTADEIATLLRNADVRALLTVPAYRGNDFVAALARAVPGLDLARPEPVFAAAAPHLRRVFVDRRRRGGRPVPHRRGAARGGGLGGAGARRPRRAPTSAPTTAW